jgi:hypothetical protein
MVPLSGEDLVAQVVFDSWRGLRLLSLLIESPLKAEERFEDSAIALAISGESNILLEPV